LTPPLLSPRFFFDPRSSFHISYFLPRPFSPPFISSSASHGLFYVGFFTCAWTFLTSPLSQPFFFFFFFQDPFLLGPILPSFHASLTHVARLGRRFRIFRPFAEFSLSPRREASVPAPFRSAFSPVRTYFSRMTFFCQFPGSFSSHSYVPRRGFANWPGVPRSAPFNPSDQDSVFPPSLLSSPPFHGIPILPHPFPFFVFSILSSTPRRHFPPFF